MSKLVCWSCGAPLKDIPLPFTRLEQCKTCRADLHVCRQCRFYNPNHSDKCDHDMAEPARDPAVANFCHYFRPKTDAFTQDKKSRSDVALQELKSLFGDKGENESEAVTDTSEELSEVDKARAKFDDLFKSTDK